MVDRVPGERFHMVETETQTEIFEFSGSWLCLDFTNTVHDRENHPPHELLNSYSDILSWSQQAGTVTASEAQQLFEKARTHPAEATTVLQQAIALREAIYRIFSAIAADSSPAEADLLILNTLLSQAMCHARIVPKADEFTWDWVGKEQALDALLWQVARSAADLLTSEKLNVVRVCESDDCTWLFLDTSKNHSRRWCDMQSCGNRAKAKRHYSRKKQTS